MEALELIYIPENAARDKLFMRDLFKNYPNLPGKSLLVHYPGVETLDIIRFASKRISANLSEHMVPNHARSGDERQLIAEDPSPEAPLHINEALFNKMFKQVHAIVLNTIIQGQQGAVLAQPGRVLVALRGALKPDRVTLFPENPNSHLATEPRCIINKQDYEELKEIYPEEDAMLSLAYQLAPAYIAGATNFHHAARV